MTAPNKAELTNRLAAQLGEHFDSVQIMATWNEGGKTKFIFTGCGNWYARQGMAHEFINSDIALENAKALAAQLPQQD